MQDDLHLLPPSLNPSLPPSLLPSSRSRYFVPKEGLPNKAAFIGLFANDLAIGGPNPPKSKDEYEDASGMYRE